jgi:hypothetical protein
MNEPFMYIMLLSGLIISELLVASCWVKPYFFFGIPVIIKRIEKMNSEKILTPLVFASLNVKSITFKHIDENTVLVRDKIFILSLLSIFRGFHGFLIEKEDSVQIKFFLNFSYIFIITGLILMLVFVTIDDLGKVFMLFFFIIITIPLFINRMTYNKLIKHILENKNKVLTSKGKQCPYCHYDRLTSFDNKCPQCKAVIHSVGYGPQHNR